MVFGGFLDVFKTSRRESDGKPPKNQTPFGKFLGLSKPCKPLVYKGFVGFVRVLVSRRKMQKPPKNRSGVFGVLRFFAEGGCCFFKTPRVGGFLSFRTQFARVRQNLTLSTNTICLVKTRGWSL